MCNNNTNKFVITKGMDNEFIITIKQNGTTLPMVIVTNNNYFTTEFTPKFSSVPYTPYSPAVAAVAAVAGQPYIAPTSAIPGKPEITCVRLVNGYATDTVAYTVYINGTAFTKTFSTGSHVNMYGLLSAIATDINSHTSIKLKVKATVDNNTLILTGVNLGESININTSDNMRVEEVQAPFASVAATSGQVYISNSPAKAAVAAIAEKQAHFKYTGEFSTVNIANLIDFSKVTNVKVSFSKSVDHVKVGSSSITAVNGKYNLGVATEFNVIEKAANTEVFSIPESITVYIEISTGVYSDLFESALYDIASGVKVLDVPTEVYSANNGKLRLTISTAQASLLTNDRGDRADYYYSKPMYKLVINCDTVNNGKFIAKVGKVYVE